jgi:hypothetical protein
MILLPGDMLLDNWPLKSSVLHNVSQSSLTSSRRRYFAQLVQIVLFRPSGTFRSHLLVRDGASQIR